MKFWSFLFVICLWQPCRQAFDQCEMTLSTLGVMRISSEDTAAAAQVLSETFHVSLLNSILRALIISTTFCIDGGLRWQKGHRSDCKCSSCRNLWAQYSCRKYSGRLLLISISLYLSFPPDCQNKLITVYL